MPVTAEQVRSVLRVVSEDTLVDEELTTAAELVTAHLGAASLSSSLLDRITLYVAAHLVSIGIPQARLSSIDVGGIRESYRDATAGDGLASTSWGQQAMALDPTGILASLASGEGVSKAPVLRTL